jgi:hypothetical protein
VDRSVGLQVLKPFKGQDHVLELKDYMHRNHSIAPVRYIPFKKFHVAPLSDITPEAVKHAANLACTTYRDHEVLQLPTALNFISQRLGFKSGFGDFREEYHTKLSVFMKAHGLLVRKDLITRNDPGFDIVSLRPREVSDRLVFQGQPLPRKIFTGYDVDWFELNNRFFYNNPWREDPAYDEFCLPYDVVMERFSKAERQSPGSAMQILEAAVAACDFHIRSGASNLLGDQLLWFQDDRGDELKFVPRVYRPKHCSPENFHRQEERIRDVTRLLRFWIERLGKGWVELIPYNEALLFLKGCDGAYDFLIPGFRDELFNHNPFQPYLRNADVPKSNDVYHFRRWLYFEFEGWLEAETHRSEITFYSRERTPADYPGPEDVLKQHLILSGAYRQPKKTAKGADGFYPTNVDGIWLYVRNLVSIREFREFMAQNPEYAAYSRKVDRVDHWESVNCDDDPSLPAAVTWYDANAYAAWISRTRGLPVRLLSDEEYQEIARPIIQPPEGIQHHDFLNTELERLCRFFHRDGTPIIGHPPYLPEEDFQNLKLCFIPEAMTWKQSPSGLNFLTSYHFGEWLNEEAAAVNSRSLSCLYNLGVRPGRGRFSAKSTGKYKSKKIGFRLCYLAEEANKVEAQA